MNLKSIGQVVVNKIIPRRNSQEKEAIQTIKRIIVDWDLFDEEEPDDLE